MYLLLGGGSISIDNANAKIAISKNSIFGACSVELVRNILASSYEDYTITFDDS
jgi:hypothetical protein